MNTICSNWNQRLQIDRGYRAFAWSNVLILLALVLSTVCDIATATEPRSSRRPRSVLMNPVQRESSRRDFNLQATQQPVLREARLQPELLPPSKEPEPIKPPAPTASVLEGIDVSLQPIGSIDISRKPVREGVQLPPDHAMAVFGGQKTIRPPALAAAPLHRLPRVHSEFCYRQLYFEEANYERFGTRRGCIQPLWSAARFYATIPALPYLMANEPPNLCQYQWYGYEAGRSAPRVREMPPLTFRGGLVEASVAVGLIFLIP